MEFVERIGVNVCFESSQPSASGHSQVSLTRNVQKLATQLPQYRLCFGRRMGADHLLGDVASPKSNWRGCCDAGCVEQEPSGKTNHGAGRSCSSHLGLSICRGVREE